MFSPHSSSFVTPEIVLAAGIPGAASVPVERRRGLVLISKAMINLVNDVEFGKKEPFMAVLEEVLVCVFVFETFPPPLLLNEFCVLFFKIAPSQTWNCKVATISGSGSSTGSNVQSSICRGHNSSCARRCRSSSRGDGDLCLLSSRSDFFFCLQKPGSCSFANCVHRVCQ
jgi:hypothetical protein